MHFKLVDTSYSKDDVVILLKDLTGGISAQSTEEREQAIQSGVHYSEMLPLEYKPTQEYMDIYSELLNKTKNSIAGYIKILSDRLMHTHNNEFVIVSLARAGIPIGILVKRYIKKAYGVDIPHYSISIIRGKGIDMNAMEYIRGIHPDVSKYQFLDGWTGKGAIKNQLNEAIKELKQLNIAWDKINPSLAVLADPAHISEIYGTREDIIIPSSCLNSTVSGLVSRTILRDDLINTETEFHGAVYFGNLIKEDKSAEFINEIEAEFDNITEFQASTEFNDKETGLEVAERVSDKYGIYDITKVKPGIGETTRVLLRRVPWCVIINTRYKDSPDLIHINRLCEEKGIDIIYEDIGGYKTCGIIKDLSADA